MSEAEAKRLKEAIMQSPGLHALEPAPAAPAWSMGLQGWAAVVGNLTASTLVCTLFAAGAWLMMSAYFEQAREDRALCRQQVAAVHDAVERQTQVLNEVRRALDRLDQGKR